MKYQADFRELACRECIDAGLLDFDFSMAFQPIVNTRTREIFAHEALVRGPQAEPASFVFANVKEGNRYRFDQSCRVKAVSLAAKLKLPGMLSINFMPNAVYRPELCIRTTLKAAETYGFPVDRIIFEATEGERVEDGEHLRGILQHYQIQGFKTALDDFGAGYSGLYLLAECKTDFIKLDMALIRNIHLDRSRQAIVRGMALMCAELGVKVVAEGIECREELEVLESFGIELFQGFYFARPAFEQLPDVMNL